MNPPPRRVLMTADCVGGVWSYALQLAAGLAPFGVEVTLVVMGSRLAADQAREAARVPNLHIVARALKLEWMQEPERDLQRADDILLDLEAGLAPDIVHVNGFANAAAGFRAPVVTVAHSCVSTWWTACKGAPAGPEWSPYRDRLRRGVAAADRLVAPTRAMLDAFVEAHGVLAPGCVIANGRNAGRYRAAPKRAVVLGAGRLWDEAKNVATLCRAARGIDAPVLIAGEGNLPADAPANVTALGRLPAPQLARAMGQAAVFAAPARYEPFGLATLEAALSGCALVLGDIATQRELWDGVATFVAPDDADALAAAAGRLLADPARAGVAARRRARRYSATAMAQGYMDLYGGLLAEGKAERPKADRPKAREKVTAA